ncbi:MAG: DNRLRE domain-containing protein [Ruminococcaceae bacterium]|nr:DNRLRE domain-containing protein [Oscillospiraceae bacterium]
MLNKKLIRSARALKAKKQVVFILSMVMILNGMIFSTSGETATTGKTEARDDSNIYVKTEEDPSIIGEIVEWRGEGVRHYYLGDGMYQAVISTNVENESGVAPTALTPNSTAMEDTYIYSGQPTTSFGSSSTLPVSNTQIAYIYCPMPELPDDAYIKDAYLYFYFNNNNTSGYMSIGAYQVLCRWRESSFTWNAANTHTNMGMSTTSLGTVSLYGTTQATRARITITNAARSWYETNDASNFGIGLKRRSGTNSSVTLLSSESGGATAPYIVIDYTLGYTVEEGEYLIHNPVFCDREIPNNYACLMQTNSNNEGDTDADPNVSHFCELEYISGMPSQKWELEFLENGYYAIRSVEDDLVLAVQSGGENTNEAIIVRETFTGVNRQQWKITRANDGAYKFKPKSSESYDTDWAMGIKREYPDFGQNIRQIAYTDDSYYNDEWNLRKVGDSVFLLGVEDAVRYSCLMEVMTYTSEMGYSTFNVQCKESFTKEEVLTQMENSDIYVSVTHGATYGVGSIIYIDEQTPTSETDEVEEIIFADIYDYQSNTALYDFSNCELMIFIACQAAKNERSICDAAFRAGASCVIGFTEIINAQDANLWCKIFFENYKAGLSVETCKYLADTYEHSSGIIYNNLAAIQSSVIFD